MKKSKKKWLLLGVFFAFSCNVDESKNEKDVITINGFNIEENVLSFKSSNDLKLHVDGLKNGINTDLIKRKLQKSYNKGFVPLAPQTENLEFIEKIVAEKRKLEKSNKSYRMIDVDGESFDVDDDLILDDDFASFLNVNREIIVNDTLYTYTQAGIFVTHKDNISIARQYLLDNPPLELYTTPEPGIYPTENPKLSVVVPSPNPCGGISGYDELSLDDSPVYDDFTNNNVNNLNFESCYSHNIGGSGGGGSYLGSSQNDHTQSLLDYVDDLEACDSSNNLKGIFGPDRRCWSAFSKKRRTKTVFWKHNYWVYQSIGVKVKHQKKHRLGWWYASDDNDEIALMINKAYFKMKPNFSITNVHNHYSTHIFFGDKVYNSQAQLISSYYPNGFELPSLPLQAEFVISDVIQNTTGFSYSPDKVKKIVYEQLWNQLKHIKGSQPKTINYYLFDTAFDEIHFLHVNVEERKTGKKKIKKTFDFQFNIAITFNIYGQDSSGTTPITTSISFPGLYNYKDADIDIVGVSRKGNVWRGSKLIFTK